MTYKVEFESQNYALFDDFTQVTARLKNLMGWLLVLGLKEGSVKCSTLYVKSWVILVQYSVVPIVLGCVRIVCKNELLNP